MQALFWGYIMPLQKTDSAHDTLDQSERKYRSNVSNVSGGVSMDADQINTGDNIGRDFIRSSAFHKGNFHLTINVQYPYGGEIDGGPPRSLDLPEETPLGPDGLHILKVVGESMKDERIERSIIPGDHILVRCQSWAEEGQIAVVWLRSEEGRTLKRFFAKEEPGYVWLVPANPSFSTIRVPCEDVVIHGVFVRKIDPLPGGEIAID
jgi:hypothetical protein